MGNNQSSTSCGEEGRDEGRRKKGKKEGTRAKKEVGEDSGVVGGESLKNFLMESCMDEILPGRLYLGSQYAAGHKDGLIGQQMEAKQALEFLKRHGITHILAVAPCEEKFPKEFHYLTLPLSDSSTFDLLSRLETTNAFISKALKEEDDAVIIDGVPNEGKRGQTAVLVHCQLGQSRSAAVVMAYLMWSRGISFSSAFDFVKSKRSLISDEKFGEQLKRYEDLASKARAVQQPNPSEADPSPTSTSSTAASSPPNPNPTTS